MNVTGILSISNGSGLQYPYPVVVHNLQRLCDNVIVGVDPSFPLDRQNIDSFGLSNVQIVDAPWDRTNRNGGTEIALQMDRLVEVAKSQESDWVVVMQADEVIHDDDFEMLRMFMDRNTYTPITGFSMKRVYYWKNLETIRADWNARLVRVFKPGTYSFLAEGTSKDGMYSGPIVTGVEVDLPYKIHHYSRVDSDPNTISRRVRNLDTFFHPETSLIPEQALPAYDFVTRDHDNFGKKGPPEEVVGKLVPFSGTHPIGVREWYRE